MLELIIMGGVGGLPRKRRRGRRKRRVMSRRMGMGWVGLVFLSFWWVEVVVGVGEL